MIIEPQPVDKLVYRFATCCKEMTENADTLERRPQAIPRRTPDQLVEIALTSSEMQHLKKDTPKNSSAMPFKKYIIKLA